MKNPYEVDSHRLVSVFIGCSNAYGGKFAGLFNYKPYRSLRRCKTTQRNEDER